MILLGLGRLLCRLGVHRPGRLYHWPTGAAMHGVGCKRPFCRWEKR